jgi:branched-chain amino acid transport system substrate-binding protein
MLRLVKFTAIAAALFCIPVLAETNDVIRIGVLNDQSSVYADFQGPGSVLAAKMAVEDYGGKAAGKKVEVVSADHQNKPDIGAAIARKWFENEGVSMIADVPNSAVAFAVADIARDQNKVFIGSGAGSSLITGAKCSPNIVHWTYDTWSYGHGVAKALMQRGAKSFYFITADYAFGQDLEKQASDEIVANGGKVLGSARHPIGVSDFSSFLLQAQSSGAEVVLFANAGGDQTNSLKQSAEFHLADKQKLAGLIFGITNIPALGLEASKGILLLNPFYWDMNDQTRAWAKRYQERHDKKQMPNDMHAGVYASVLHYLKAVDKVGGAGDGKAVVAAMKGMPTDDPLFGKGEIRQDGRKIHPMYLFQVKAPSESKAPWDYFKRLATIPASEAFRPLADGNCPLVTAR